MISVYDANQIIGHFSRHIPDFPLYLILLQIPELILKVYEMVEGNTPWSLTIIAK